MQPEQYPPQEPLSAPGIVYGRECLRRGADVAGVSFGFGPDPYQSVTVHPASRPDGRVLLFWHGGGWTSGYKEWMSFMAPAFNAAGITFVTAGYRLAPQNVFPVGVDDCAAGVQWTVRNIAAHGGDPRRLWIGGHSAGGHYAALLAVRRDWQAPLGLPVDVVRGCLPISGVYDFTASSGLANRPRFLGPDETERAASPRFNLQAPLPPFLLAHGTADFPHLVRQAEAFENDLRAAGARVERIAMEGRDHFSASYAGGEPDGPWVPAALAFMAR